MPTRRPRSNKPKSVRLFKALRDPRTQRAVGYLVALLRSVGEVLDRGDAPHRSLPA